MAKWPGWGSEASCSGDVLPVLRDGVSPGIPDNPA
jgi:hypothetical protein